MRDNFKTLFGSTDIETSESTWIINYPYWTDEYIKKMTLFKDISISYDNKTTPKETEGKEEILRQIEELLKKL